MPFLCTDPVNVAKTTGLSAVPVHHRRGLFHKILSIESYGLKTAAKYRPFMKSGSAGAGLCRAAGDLQDVTRGVFTSTERVETQPFGRVRESLVTGRATFQ